ncbi:MAG: endonuclease/exonuclease/phosphatase family protein [Acidobacteriaceae bacterium]
MRIRLVSYNIHKCKGMDGLVRPQRFIRLLSDLAPDVAALQEVLLPHAEYIVGAMPGYQLFFSTSRLHNGAAYGNATLARETVALSQVLDISTPGRERRTVLQTDIQTNQGSVHLFNVHLGTSFFERRLQTELLLSPKVLSQPTLRHPRILAGDFNEWARGVCTRRLAQEFCHPHLHRPKRNYPGVIPLFHLDRIYFDCVVKVIDFAIVRTPLSLLASDHVPILADLDIPLDKDVPQPPMSSN